MSYADDEVSVELAQPIECYLFKYKNQEFAYTTAYYSQTCKINGVSHVFVPEYIKRGEDFTQSDSSSGNDNCIITVSRSNSVAMLYQGTPPEQDAITVQIYRMHGENNNQNIRILKGVVSQVKFSDSDAELTITIERILSKEIPRGKLSYFCQNTIYDNKCRLSRESYKKRCWIDGEKYGLTIRSSNLLDAPTTDYYTDGYLVMGRSFRAIEKHDGDLLVIKYPINKQDWADDFYVYPGCSNLFSECNSKFSNTANFSGIPYQQPYDPIRHPTTKGVYWVNGNIVYRDTNGELFEMDLG